VGLSPTREATSYADTLPPHVPILSQTSPVQPNSRNLISTRSILMLYNHLRLGLPNGSFPLIFPPITYTDSHSPHLSYLPPTTYHLPPHPPRLDNSNCTWRRVQITKILVMRFPPPSRHLIPLRSKYSPQHPSLKHLQSMFLP
jgi:hypothetical protein